MAEIRGTLEAADTIGLDDADAARVTSILELLEVGGAQVGALQIGCCAPGRLPLYERMLERLTRIQLDLNRSLGRGH